MLGGKVGDEQAKWTKPKCQKPASHVSNPPIQLLNELTTVGGTQFREALRSLLKGTGGSSAKLERQLCELDFDDWDDVQARTARA